MTKEEIVENIHKRIEGGVAKLTPFERVLVEYAVEETLKMVKK